MAIDVDQVREWYEKAKQHQKKWREEARECYDFYSGHQFSDDEEADLEENLRAKVTFNRIQPMVAAVRGFQINNRKEARYLPRQLGDIQVNELLTGAAAWVDDQCNAEDEQSDAFEDMLICGMGWCETRISYDEDLDGKIYSDERISPLEMFWDPTSYKRNLRDSKYRIRARWMKVDDAEARWPEVSEMDMSDADAWDEPGHDTPHDASRAHFYERDAEQWYNPHDDEIFVLQVQWWEYAIFYRTLDPQSGELVSLSESRWNKIKDSLPEGWPKVRQKKKQFKQAFLVGPEVLEEGDAPYPEGFTLRCMTGKRDLTHNHWFGLVRGLIDPQRWSNKFFMDIQDTLISNRQGGAFVEETALINPRQAEEDWNQANPLIMVRDGALGKGAIQERNPIAYPQGTDRIMEWAISALPATSGINPEMMGYTDRDQANVLEIQRKKSAINVLADMFDAMRQFLKERANVLLHFMQTYMNDGRLIRITDAQGKEQFVQMALDPNVTEYDVIVDESSSSPNQREETFGILMALAPHLAQANIPVPMDIIDYVPLPSALTASWKEHLEPKPPSPEQQQANELLMRGTAAEIQEREAKAQKDAADAERIRADALKTQHEAEAQRIENQFVQELGGKPGNLNA